MASVVYHFCLENCLSKILFSNPFPKEHSDCESQKSGFGFDLKNPPRVWILRIHDPFLDLPKQMQNPSLDLDTRLDFPTKHTHRHYKEQIRPINSLQKIKVNVSGTNYLIMVPSFCVR